MKILVADDDPELLEGLRKLLETKGFAVIAARSGAAAVEAAREVNLDLAVLGVALPDQSGIDVCLSLKAQVESFLPNVLLLSQDSTEDRVRALEGGADDLLPKPIDERELLARIKALLRIKTLHDEVRHLAALREQIVYTVSHDFRTPVVGIRGAVQNLVNGLVGELTPEQREYLELVDQATNRLSDMTDQMCRAAKRVKRGGELRREEVDLRKAAETAAAGLRPEIVERKLRLEIKAALETPQAVGDPEALTQVLANLLDNAVKHSPAGGRILVEIGRDVERCGARAHVVVSDEGPGIARSDFERIFYRFEQVGDPEHTKSLGTGLGLSICKEIMDAHGGKIWVESERGRGAQFHLRIPAAAQVRGAV